VNTTSAKPSSGYGKPHSLFSTTANKEMVQG